MATLDILTRVRIKAMLVGDPDIGTLDIGVDVVSGEVTLFGDVETEEQKQLAEDLAQQVPDVLTVVNQLRVVGEETEIEKEELIEG